LSLFSLVVFKTLNHTNNVWHHSIFESGTKVFQSIMLFLLYLYNVSFNVRHFAVPDIQNLELNGSHGGEYKENTDRRFVGRDPILLHDNATWHIWYDVIAKAL
jgi:hypothetical protein